MALQALTLGFFLPKTLVSSLMLTVGIWTPPGILFTEEGTGSGLVTSDVLTGSESEGCTRLDLNAGFSFVTGFSFTIGGSLLSNISHSPLCLVVVSIVLSGSWSLSSGFGFLPKIFENPCLHKKY